MTNSELEKKIEELSAQIEALKSELKEEKPKGEIWKPKLGEEFSYIDTYSETYTIQNVGSDDIEELIECGNAFQGDEKAEFEANREKYTRLFRQYIEQHNGYKLNWKHADPSKWYVYYNWEKEEIYYDNCYQEQGMGVYGTSKQVMQDAVEFVGHENFLRYIIGVEE
jgi:hypothetical protein